MCKCRAVALQSLQWGALQSLLLFPTHLFSHWLITFWKSILGDWLGKPWMEMSLIQWHYYDTIKQFCCPSKLKIIDPHACITINTPFFNHNNSSYERSVLLRAFCKQRPSYLANVLHWACSVHTFKYKLFSCFLGWTRGNCQHSYGLTYNYSYNFLFHLFHLLWSCPYTFFW